MYTVPQKVHRFIFVITWSNNSVAQEIATKDIYIS